MGFYLPNRVPDVPVGKQGQQENPLPHVAVGVTT